MRVVLKGIHRVKRRLASGDIRIHYYAWRGGPVIHAKPGTPEFVHAYNEAHNSIRQPRAGALMTRSAHRPVHNMSTWRNRLTQLPAPLSVRAHSASGLVGFPRPPCILAKNLDNLTCTLLPLFDMNRIDGQRSGNGVGLFRSGALGAARIRCPCNPISGIPHPEYRISTTRPSVRSNNNRSS